MKLSRIWLAGAALVLAANVSFAQGFGRGGRGGGGFGLLGLTTIPAVQTELKLDAAQIDLLKQLSAEAQAKAQANRPAGGFQNLSDEERQKLFADFQKAQAETDKKVAEVLDAKQVTRLKQLDLQRQGTRALMRKDLQEALKLTPEQQTKIKTVSDGQREAFRAAFQGAQNQTPEERRATFTKMQAEIDGKLLGILTADQKKQFESMKGAPFTFPQPTRPAA